LDKGLQSARLTFAVAGAHLMGCLLRLGRRRMLEIRFVILLVLWQD